MNALALEQEGYPWSAFIASCLGHIILMFMLLVGVTPRPGKPAPQVVYAVTLEGSSLKGGISQIPKATKPTPVAPPKKVIAPPLKSKAAAKVTAAPVVKPEPKKETIKTTPSVKEKAEVIISKRKEALISEPKPQASLAPQASPAAASKKDEAAVEVKPTQAPVQPPSAADINNRYQQALQRYLGESTDAGGKGFGGDGRGGKGMGGGIVRPPEWFLYKDLLESYIKRGWNWFDPTATLKTTVTFEISQAGEISNIKLLHSSGNAPYDESVLRAISKASPVPAPPPMFYGDFKFVELDFEPS